jgi:hypothetical protein
MDTIGVDLHKRESQLCIMTGDGELIERRIVTSARGSRPPLTEAAGRPGQDLDWGTPAGRPGSSSESLEGGCVNPTVRRRAQAVGRAPS